ncbi:alpha/beta fold hydrolase [Amycolatopsis anabasis]|uniref:alpha/beta fold hydrolase n=1 Tax=Amycolatopsis anabasis TaxID=1840409 RepID=UPI00131AC59D|nr:alpha/beta fold hydrolase [Amycolatopsis anabasis]
MAELPLVLLHAFPLDARMWNPVREPLAARTRLITPDQRGLGRTKLPETDRAPSLEDAALDVLALLDKLELEKVVLGGCSMGGYLTLAVLRAAPERIGGLVLIDTKATADAPAAAENRRAIARRAESDGVTGWLATSMLPKLLSVGTIYRRPDIAETVRDLADSQPPSGIAWAQRAMAARPDSRELLAETEIPALVIVGSEDKLTPPDAARELAEALPNGELVVVPGAGHLTPLEKPAAVTEAILDWYPGS